MRAVHVCVVVAVAACADATPPDITAKQTQSSIPSFSVAGQAEPTVFNVQMSAANEPGPISLSESKGHAQVKVYADGTIEFVFTINNKSSETFTRAHIHKAPAGVNGPIHWDFLEPADPATSISDQPSQLRGIARARAAAVLADLLANPSGYYVNVHSLAFPGGAVRGQLE
jgi:hypothetical protein